MNMATSSIICRGTKALPRPFLSYNQPIRQTAPAMAVSVQGGCVQVFLGYDVPTVSQRLAVVRQSSKTHSSYRESWWFGEEVQTKIAAKQARFRELLLCREGNQEDRAMAKERYKAAKREAKIAVAQAKDKAYEDLYKKLDSKEGANDIYRIAKARERRRRDLGNIRYIKDEEGRTIVIEEDIRKRWGEYFSSLFNESRPERSVVVENSSQPLQLDCYYSRINQGEVRVALQKMGRNKAVGPDQIPIEAWRCLGDEGIKWLTCLFNKIFSSAKMPDEWRLSEVIPIYKNKGDAQIVMIRKSSCQVLRW
ncbi:hypothetical protein Tco_0609558 [Tanacetum coccineum]